MQRQKLNKAILVVLVTFLGAFTASAQSEKNRPQKPPTVEELFEHMDANEDGKLSKKEVKGPLKDDFDKVDANKDGFISKEELEKAPKPEGKRPARKN